MIKRIPLEQRLKISNTLKGKHCSPNTEFKKGDKKKIETKIRMSKSQLGHKVSNETKLKIGKSNRIKLKGMPKSEEHRIKISIGNKGKVFSEESRKKMSESAKGKKISLEQKSKLRIASLNYIKKVCGIICPRIGHNEKQLLDNLENELNYKILRQYECEGYFLDGYIQEINLAIEVDEKPKNKEKDIEREKIIRNKLGCEFMRVKDYD